MRRNLMIATASALVCLAACGGSGHDLESLGPPPEASPTGNVPPVSPSPATVTGTTGATGTTGGTGALPTTSPGITGSVTSGTASIAVSGALQTSQTALPLASPAIYSPPPGTLTLAWTAAAAGIALGGSTFLGTRPTSATVRFSFFIHSASGTASFVSEDGGCDVTVTTAEPTSLAGTFTCLGITDVSGTTAVNAQGAFSATG